MIETNIPISSIYAKTYDGYVMRRDLGFYVNEVPAAWTFVMNIVYENDIVLYRGMAYPSKSAPLIYTGTGKGLLDKITEAVTKIEIQTREQEDSMNFLVKFGNLSASVYSYIDSRFEEAYEYYQAAKGDDRIVPDNIMGSRYAELDRIMNYLINTVKG